MLIDKGVYTLADRKLVLDLADGFDLTGETCRYILTGENGVGKTSFLEMILIPALQRHHVDFLYIGQDIRNQLYTLRALLATMGLSVISSDERELLRTWIVNSPGVSVLIMDEFDKYFSEDDFIFQWTKGVIESSFVVSHHEQPNRRIDPHVADRICRMRFERAGQDGSLRRVRIHQELL
jgi:hypothetical protein